MQDMEKRIQYLEKEVEENKKAIKLLIKKLNEFIKGKIEILTKICSDEEQK